MGVESMVGDYACWNYFQSVESEENRDFIRRFKKRYGEDRVVTDPMEAAYFGVYLWAEAVKHAGTLVTGRVLEALPGQSYDAPEGLVHIDGRNNHCWKRARVGQIVSSGQFETRWDSGRSLRPIPYPSYRSRAEWNRFVEGLYHKWGGNWAKPVGGPAQGGVGSE